MSEDREDYKTEQDNSQSKLSEGLNALVATWENRLLVLKASIDDASKENDFRAGLMWQYHHQNLSMCLAELKTAAGI